MVDMFNRIQPYAVESRLFPIPFPPTFQFVPYGGISEIDIVIHQIVVITFFVVDDLVPSVAVIVLDSVNGGLLCPVIIVYSAETAIIPDELRIFSFSPREGEAGKGLYIECFAGELSPVLGVYLSDL